MSDVKKKAIKVILMAGLLSAPFVSQADDVTCSEELYAVEVAIGQGVYTGKRYETDESNLQTKLTAARSKLELDKYSDSVDKLLGISDKATALAGARKSKLVSAADINYTVGNAIACVPQAAL